MELTFGDEAATQAFGAALAATLPDLRQHRLLLTLAGDLGAGKTTLVRALLRTLGVTGTVRSPTFTLVEPYETTAGLVHHLDLYRLVGGAVELEALGYRDYRSVPGLVLIEWPERGGAAAGTADISIKLEHADLGRSAGLSAGSDVGRDWLQHAFRHWRSHQLSDLSS